MFIILFYDVLVDLNKLKAMFADICCNNKVINNYVQLIFPFTNIRDKSIEY